MAHVGQEVGLGPRRGFGGFLGQPQRLGGFVLGGDVLDYPDQSLGWLRSIQRLGGHPGPKLRTVFTAESPFGAVRSAHRQRSGDFLPNAGAGRIVRIPAARGLADQFAGAVAENLLQLAVAPEHDAIHDEDDAGRGGLKDGALLFVGGVQLDGLFFQLGRLAPGRLQQLLGAQGAQQHVQTRRYHFVCRVQQRPLRLIRFGEGGQFDHRQSLAPVPDGGEDHDAGLVLSQAGDDGQIIGGNSVDHDGLVFQRGLPDQAQPRRKAVRPGARFGDAIAADPIQIAGRFVPEVTTGDGAVQQGSQRRQQQMGELGGSFGPLQGIANMRQAVLDPALPLDFCAGLAVGLQGSGQLADFRTVVLITEAHALVAGQQALGLAGQGHHRRHDPALKEHQQGGQHGDDIQNMGRGRNVLDQPGLFRELLGALRQPGFDVAAGVLNRLDDGGFGRAVVQAVHQRGGRFEVAGLHGGERLIFQADEGVGIALGLVDALHLLGQKAQLPQLRNGLVPRPDRMEFGLKFVPITFVASGGVGAHRVGEDVAAADELGGGPDGGNQRFERLFALRQIIGSQLAGTDTETGE